MESGNQINIQTKISSQSSIPSPKLLSNIQIKILIIFILLSLITNGFLIYQNLQLKKQVINPQTTTLMSPFDSNREISQLSKKILPLVDESLLKIEKDVLISPSEEFTIISSLLSPNKTMLAFSEVTNCFNPDYVSCIEKANYDINIKCQTCEVVYRLSVKDLGINRIQLLYEFPKNGSSKELTKDSFFDRYFSSSLKPVYAGALINYVLFPYAWTTDSKTLITEDGILQSAPTEGPPSGYFLINLQTNNVKSLGQVGQILFNSNFSKAIKLEISSNNFPYTYPCYPGLISHGDKIVIINLLNTDITKLLEGDVYSLKEVSNGKLKYNFMTKQEADQYLKEDDMHFCSTKPENFTERTIDLP